MDFLHAVLNGWVEMNFDDVAELGDHRLRKSVRILGDSGCNLRDDRSQRDSHRRPVDDRLQMNRHSCIARILMFRIKRVWIVSLSTRW